MYPSCNYEDDLAWGASWLYRKTGEKQFLDVRAQLAHRVQGLALAACHPAFVCPSSNYEDDLAWGVTWLIVARLASSTSRTRAPSSY